MQNRPNRAGQGGRFAVLFDLYELEVVAKNLVINF